MKPFEEEVTRRVIRVRQLLDLNKTEFAAKLGLSKQAYQPYENFARPFTLDHLHTISHFSGYALTYFLGLPTAGISLSEDEAALLIAFREIKNRDLRQMALRMVRAVANPASVNVGSEPVAQSEAGD